MAPEIVEDLVDQLALAAKLRKEELAREVRARREEVAKKAGVAILFLDSEAEAEAARQRAELERQLTVRTQGVSTLRTDKVRLRK